MPADFYELLGVGDDASPEDVKRAFRERAREYHPDVNDHPRAQQQFKTLNEAYEILSDRKERARYDRLGHRDYVDQHLDGLPTMGSPGKPAEESETSSDDRPTDATGTADATPTATSSSRSSTSSRSASSQSSTSRSATSSGDTASTSSTKTAASESKSSRTSSTSTSSTARTSASSAAHTSTSSASGATRASGNSTRTSSTGDRTGQRRRRRGGHRTGLRRGWIATLLSLCLYLLGVAGYLVTGGGVAAFDRIRSEPVAALLASTPLAEPIPLVVDAGAGLTAGGSIESIGPAVVFAAGIIALPLAIGITVGRYGRGSAYLYPVAMGLPLAYAVARLFASPPLAADVLLFAILPIGAALVFTVDTGRYLFASEKAREGQ